MITSKTPLYSRWTSMNGRCRDVGHSKYRYYGGKGIRVCADWRNDFDAFREWAMRSGFDPGLSIDRINPDLGYEPNNCQWIPIEENRGKARTAKGNTHYKAVLTDDLVLLAYRKRQAGMSVAAIAREYNVSRKTLAGALNGTNWKHIKAIVDSGVLKENNHED